MGKDSRQGRYSSRSATSHLRRQAIGGWSHALRLQHSERVHVAFGVEVARWLWMLEKLSMIMFTTLGTATTGRFTTCFVGSLLVLFAYGLKHPRRFVARCSSFQSQQCCTEC